MAEGKPIDLSGMPPPPSTLVAGAASIPTPKAEKPEDYELDVKEDPTFYKAPPAAQSILESLEQRLAKYEVCHSLVDSISSLHFGRILDVPFQRILAQ